MSNNETGLMRQTKKELVDIILRKDDEEKRLKENIKENERVMATQNETITKIKKSLETANHNVEQHQSGIDEITSQKVAAEEAAKCFQKERNAARIWNGVLAIALMVIAALWILL